MISPLSFKFLQMVLLHHNQIIRVECRICGVERIGLVTLLLTLRLSFSKAIFATGGTDRPWHQSQGQS